MIGPLEMRVASPSAGLLLGRFYALRAAAVLAPVALVLSSSAPESAPPEPLRCFEPVPGVTWMPWMESGRETLDKWCASVGRPVLMTSPAEPAEVTRLVIVSWNVHVGGGQVEAFVAKHWTDRDHTGLVLLLEEAYRAGQDVSDSFPKDLKVPSAIRPKPRSLDVTGLAIRLKMSATYVPSMRNGPATVLEEREDRGNAILSTEPLADVKAIELPFGRQRRVAVAATVTPRGSTIGPLRVIATHFDTNSDRVAQAEAFGERSTELTGLPIIAGGDFNSPYGLRDKTVQAVSQHLRMEPCGTGRTNKWPLWFNLLVFLDVGRFDFIFSTLDSSGLARECRTIAAWFHSDHRPVMLTVHR